jgi:hypothetical protein
MNSFQFVSRCASPSRTPQVESAHVAADRLRSADRRWSHVGRPRRVTNAVIAEIVDWYQHHESCVQLARRLGVSTSTIRNVIRSGGTHYKTPSPEQRPAVMAAAATKRRRTR